MCKLFVSIFLSSLVLTSVAQTLNGPESVEGNPVNGGYFVSNTGSGEITRYFTGGGVVSLASGFTTGPHGLELVGDTLYACDGGFLRLVNATTGTIITSVNLGATFLNGITHKGNYIFVTDFSAKKIYRFNTKTNAYNIMKSVISTPNGIIYDYISDRLVFVTWGSSAKIYELSLADSSVTSLIATTTSNCDGIAMNCVGEFFVSSWSPSAAVKKYAGDFSTSSAVSMSGLSNPADIFYDMNNDSLYVPNAGNNTVSEQKFSSCLLGMSDFKNERSSVKLFPNPVENELTIFSNDSEIISVSVIDQSGRVLSVSNLIPNAKLFLLNVNSLSPSVYVLKIRTTKSLSHQIFVRE